jgi:acyl-CoA synthetase (AMP-forming)/AMP-acid ligase II
MAGCFSRFADPAALGETDNRARALVAGWGEDGLGRLVCPACQQRHRQSAAREMIVPEPIEFGPLPKTSTGKVQKFVLRDREWAGQDKKIGGCSIRSPRGLS